MPEKKASSALAVDVISSTRHELELIAQELVELREHLDGLAERLKMAAANAEVVADVPTSDGVEPMTAEEWLAGTLTSVVGEAWVELEEALGAAIECDPVQEIRELASKK